MLREGGWWYKVSPYDGYKWSYFTSINGRKWMPCMEVKETTILNIVPDGIVDEVNHYKK